MAKEPRESGKKPDENKVSPEEARIQEMSGLMSSDAEDQNRRPESSWKDNVYDEDCHLQQEKVEMPPGEMPPLANLLYPRRTRFEELMQKMPKPDRYIPRLHFPAWTEMPISQKLPFVPLESFYYSRGQLNQDLYRKDIRLDYGNIDPLNRRNYLPSKEYNALHDPATEKYFRRPSVYRLIQQQGLIAPNGDVICTQKEINEYREYLSRSQAGLIVKDLRSEETKKLAQRTLEKELVEYVGQSNGGYRIRRELVMERRRVETEEKMRRLKHKIREDSLKARRNKHAIEEALRKKREAARKCEEHEKKQRQKLRCQEEMTQCREAAYLEKQARAEFLIIVRKMRRELLKTLRQTEIIVAKSQAQKKEMETRKGILAKLESDQMERREARRLRIERHRKNFPMLSEKRKRNQERILNIMRKFINLWRDYVRRRKEQRADPLHQSSWDVDGTAKQTVDDLQEISGHETFDNFILNLIKMKREMAEEMEEEQPQQPTNSARKSREKRASTPSKKPKTA